MPHSEHFMGSYFLSSHGTLFKDKGNRKTQPKFIVPPNMSIYFFTPPARELVTTYSDFIMDMLVNPNFNFADELKIRAIAYEVFREGELCLDYTTTPDAKFRDPTGLYRVGRGSTLMPVIPLPLGTSKTLSQWVKGIGGGDASIGNHFYWGACRSHSAEVDRAAPNVTTFKEHTFRYAGGANAGGDDALRDESYAARYGDAIRPIEGFNGPMWNGTRNVSKEGSLMESRAKLNELLRRLKRGEGLFGPK
jgi:hypothetical protein